MPQRKASAQAYEKSSRCWPGYEPVPGKRQNQEGSCRKIPASRNAGVEVNRETSRKKAERSARTPTERAKLQMKSSSPRVRAQGRRTLQKTRRGKAASHR